MSYIPTNWKTGDIVSSQRLNKLEEGVRDAYEVMVINNNDNTLDKTWQEIYDAMAQGKLCVIRQVSVNPKVNKVKILTDIVISVQRESEEEYAVGVSNAMYSASSATGYPKLGGGPA